MRKFLPLGLIFLALACGSSPSEPEGQSATNDRRDYLETPEEFVVLESGVDSKYKSSGLFVFKNRYEWQRHYEAHRQYNEYVPQAPSVDFSKEIVIALHDGLEYSTRNKIEIVSISYDMTDGVNQVRYRRYQDAKAPEIVRETYPYSFYVAGKDVQNVEYRFIEVQ